MSNARWNGGIIGKRNVLDFSSSTGIWDVNKSYISIKTGARFNFTYGKTYALSYLQSSGGNLVVAEPGSLGSYIDSAADGDVILCPEGNYTIPPLRYDEYVSDPFRGKNILICGDTDDAGTVYIEFNHDSDPAGGVRDHAIFNAGYYTTTIYRQLAFLSFKRIAISATNFQNSLNRTAQNYGRMVNCYFDNNNGGASWNYDNSASTDIDVKYIRCTFANIAAWYVKYSAARTDVIDVGNCLFEDSAIRDADFNDIGGNITSATIDIVNRTYSAASYPTAGHLSIPENLTAILE